MHYPLGGAILPIPCIIAVCEVIPFSGRQLGTMTIWVDTSIQMLVPQTKALSMVGMVYLSAASRTLIELMGFCVLCYGSNKYNNLINKLIRLEYSRQEQDFNKQKTLFKYPQP